MIDIRDHGGIFGGASSSFVATAGDIPLLYDPREKQGPNSDVLTKVKEVKINFSGSVRISFKLKSYVSGYTSWGYIYKNGVQAGITRSTMGNSYMTFTEDFTVKKGDLIQLYVKSMQINSWAITSDLMIGTNQSNPLAMITL